MKGTVKWFNREKGFGFIQPDDGGQDVFVHMTAVRDAHYETLSENDRVQFELKENSRGKTQAERIKILN